MSARRVFPAADWRARHLGGSPPKTLSAPELQKFVDAILPTCTFDEIVRRWAIEAVAEGRLSIAELRHHAGQVQETIED